MKLLLHSIYNKNTQEKVCKHYTNRIVKDFIAETGKELKVIYEGDSFFTHEPVVDVEENCDGFWIETTKKMWRFDKI